MPLIPKLSYRLDGGGFRRWASAPCTALIKRWSWRQRGAGARSLYNLILVLLWAASGALTIAYTIACTIAYTITCTITSAITSTITLTITSTITITNYGISRYPMLYAMPCARHCAHPVAQALLGGKAQPSSMSFGYVHQ